MALLKTIILGSILALATGSPIDAGGQDEGGCAELLQARAVQTTATLANGGVVIGTATHVSNQPSVTDLATAYLAVPFAASPTRFASPVSTSFATKTATTLGPGCLANYGSPATSSKGRSVFENPFGPTPLPQSEDCLHLNVYVPPDTSDTSNKAVMVWLYGGNLMAGSNSVDAYNGSSLAVNHDVIVVVPNYRTGLFGFSSSPDITSYSPNVGFLDQRFALSWVQENIASFGGDKSNVTIFGESAGAYSVKQLLAQPPSPLPFHAAIMESAAATTGNGTIAWYQLVQHFCTGSTQSDLECLRAQSATDLNNYVIDNGLNTYPVVDYTNAASNTIVEIHNGTFANVPLLIGTNLYEASIFLETLGVSNATDPNTVLAALGVTLPSGVDLAVLYPGMTGFQLISRVVTDFAFTCETMFFAQAVANGHSAPVWRYRFDLDGASVRYFNGIGAYHSSEIFEVFGTYPLLTQYGAADDAQKGLAKYMQTAWTTFAKAPSTGPDPANWRRYLPSNFQPSPVSYSELAVLGGSNATQGIDLQNALYTDYSCAIYYPILAAANELY